jgi:uncharacterized membrane protein YfcA
LIGGGGSILAVPLILYVVGLNNPHVAIGTAALPVAANAFINIIPHARAGRVRWGPAVAFAASGVLGAALGSSVGKLVDGQRLITYFACLMGVVACLMLWARPASKVAQTKDRAVYRRLCGTGLGAGGISGFFGIGGGFLVVPGLMFAGRMPIVEAVGTSLFAVGSFGMTTAINYSLAGQVDWLVATEFVAGGMIGGLVGARASGRVAKRKGMLNIIFSIMILLVAAYMLYRSWSSR